MTIAITIFVVLLVQGLLGVFAEDEADEVCGFCVLIGAFGMLISLSMLLGSWIL